MHDRADRHGILDDVDAEVAFGQFAHQRQAFVDLLRTKMAHVEQHALAPGCRDGVALLQFVPVGLADAVARPEFHGLELRLADRRFRAHAVVLQVAAAVLVDQDAAFAAAGLGEQAAGVRQAGRVVLHELHVLEGRAGAIGHGHAVAGLDRAVGREGEHASRAAAGDDDRPGMELAQLAAAHVHRDEALAAAGVDQQVEREIFVVALDRVELQGGLEQRVQDVETRLVGGEPGALLLHAAEGPHGDRAVGLAVPRAAPVLELEQFLGCLMHEIFDAILVGEPVAAAHRIVEMRVEAVVRLDHAGRAAFRRAGVAAHGIDLGDQRDAKFRIGFREGDCGSQSGAAGADDGYISLDGFHFCLFRCALAGQAMLQGSIMRSPDGSVDTKYLSGRFEK